MRRELTIFRNILRQNGYSITQPRLRLFAALQKYNELTIAELIDCLHHQDQATVYRNIKVFEGLGIINRLRLGWHSKLELSDTFQHHHHHLSCVRCGCIFVLSEEPVIERAINRISSMHNFQPLDHQIEIRGICQNCQ